MKEIIDLIRKSISLWNATRLCRKCPKHSEDYQLATFYKYQIENWEDGEMTLANVDGLIEKAEIERKRPENSDLLQNMLSKVIDFLESLRSFV